MVRVMYEIEGTLYSESYRLPREMRSFKRTWHVVVRGKKGPAHRTRKLARIAARSEREKEEAAA
jgi:hypothetical protein